MKLICVIGLDLVLNLSNIKTYKKFLEGAYYVLLLKKPYKVVYLIRYMFLQIILNMSQVTETDLVEFVLRPKEFLKIKVSKVTT